MAKGNPPTPNRARSKPADSRPRTSGGGGAGAGAGGGGGAAAKRQREAERRRQQQQRQARNRIIAAVVGGLVVALVVVVIIASRGGSGGGSGSSSGSSKIEGLQSFSNLSQAHVSTPVSYSQTPPVGGAHNPIPQTCKAYDQPVPNERAVHSMEHGAVWITYRPDLPKADVDRLAARANSFVLVSPFPNLPAPVVASAWGKQVQLTSVDDPRLTQFISEFREGPQTPEPGTLCQGTTSLQPVTG